MGFVGKSGTTPYGSPRHTIVPSFRTPTVVTSIPVGNSPWGVAYDSGAQELFVAAEVDGVVRVISDTNNTIVANISAGSLPYGVAYDGGKGEVFVTNYNGGSVSVISDRNNSVLATIHVGSHPEDIVYDGARGELFVANSNSGSVSVISDTNNTVVATISVGSVPRWVAYDSGRGEVFVSNENSGNVSVINDTNNTVLASISAGLFPSGLGYDPPRSEIFVGSHSSNTIDVISDTNNSIVAKVPEGSGTTYLAYGRGTGELFATAIFGQTYGYLSVISDTSNRVVSNVTVGAQPAEIAYDPALGEAFVTNPNSNNVSVVDLGVSNTVTFSETGLPANTPWAVSLDGIPQTGMGSAIVFTKTPGQYPFSIGTVSGLSASPSSGTVTVNGTDVTRPVTFATPTYAAEFSESGLPARTSWSISVAGVTHSSQTRTINFTEPIGSNYRFSVGAVAGFHSTPPSGMFNVSGSIVFVSIVFSAFPTPRFPLWFNGSGLAAGENWSVIILGTGAFAGSASNYSRGDSVVFQVSAAFTGSFTVTPPGLYNVSPSSGTVSTAPAGAPTTVELIFTAQHVGIPPPPPSISSFSADPPTIALGGTVTFWANASGGTGPLSFLYLGLPEGCASQNLTRLPCTPTALGGSRVTLKVTDAAGRTAQSNTTLAVNPSPLSGPPQGTPPTNPGPMFLGLPAIEGLGLALGILAAGLVGVSILLWRRRRARSPAPETTEPDDPPPTEPPPD
jgi:YVTN family beta-propeller protein